MLTAFFGLAEEVDAAGERLAARFRSPVIRPLVPTWRGVVDATIDDAGVELAWALASGCRSCGHAGKSGGAGVATGATACVVGITTG